ncbi:hypothetical protein ASF61_19195 [Duganella sp. Leaf126]|uniref:UPF0149 family protein n=1 Tax=Duganella sp. Leaf126 TaxID=1736266 RepID=UPI0006F35B22|nr:UPF0149 family protein [Duganella sp. Leaf126]KQQ45785.1 hypothetical protein ASF61_19195 [Duganella sp. Leaf126]
MLNAPLTDDEYDQLDDLLGAISPRALDVAGLEGLLTALAIGPRPVDPASWLPLVWGEPAPADARAVQTATALVLRHAHYMQTWMQKEPASFEPIYECGGAWTAHAWTAGFEAGMQLDAAGWDALRAAAPALLAPFARAGADWEDAVTPAVIAIHAHFHPAIPATAATAAKAAKVGRNDPCPCGSAKKYKKCCGDGK